MGADHVFATTLGFLLGACCLLFPAYFLARAWNLLFRRLAFNPWTPVVLLGLFFVLADVIMAFEPEKQFDWSMRVAFLVPLLFSISRWRRYRELNRRDDERVAEPRL